MPKFDRLKMYFGYPFKVNDKVTVYEPKIGDILQLGEQDFYNMLYIFIGNPTTYRLALWKANIDWNKISDYELFLMLYKTIDHQSSKLLFGDLDFSKLQAYWVNEQSQDQEGNPVEKKVVTLYDKDNDIEVSEKDYKLMSQYIKTMFNIFPKVEKARGRATKESIIWEDQENLKKHKNDTNSSTLLPLISSCINHPGFKYKLEQLKQVGIVQFMDSVQRLQVYETSTALLKGSYSGFIDTSKINKDEFNFMRDLDSKK